jgi:hypothetical protein
LVIPDPGNFSKYYIFQNNIGLGATQPGLYYSIVDLSFNNGNGKIISKNNIITNSTTAEPLTAVKHGNGRDWWVLFRYYATTNIDNTINSLLVSPTGIGLVLSQNIASFFRGGIGRFVFNSDGNKLLSIGGNYLINAINFDRCSGLLSNENIISPGLPDFVYPYLASGAFSPNGDIIYLCEYDTANTFTSYLCQYDLTASNILGSRLTLDTLTRSYSNGSDFTDIKLAPDGKIYITSGPDCYGLCFPYPDSLHTPNTDYLSVINNPDSAGFACNYQRLGYYLGGKRTYQGLPNNPNYELGRLISSPCDSLTALLENKKLLYSVYPNPANNQITFSSAGASYSPSQLDVFNLVGERIYTAVMPARTQHYNVPVLNWQPGLYFYKISNESSVSSGKFVVQR